MRWLAKLRMQLEMLFGRDRAGKQLDAELRDHLERQVAENIGAGMSADEARYAALRSFGNPALLREQARSTWSWNWLARSSASSVSSIMNRRAWPLAARACWRNG